jgi:hypothetical protein
MGFTRQSRFILMLGVSSFFLSPVAIGAPAIDSVPNPKVLEKFDQAVDRTEDLVLPINKVVLYREAATALISTDKPRAVLLLKRALSDIDAAEADNKARGTLDAETLHRLDFYRLPVIMLMERIDPTEASDVLAPPQLADDDTTFQTLFFERLKNPEMVQQLALHKLGFGVTPAVIAAYGVLKQTSPEVARSLAAAIVLKLSNTDPAKNPEAVHSAFLLIHLLRTDVGALAPKMVIDPDLLKPDLLSNLFSFIADAFLASKDPENLILGSRPQLYVSAIETYAPDKTQQVAALPFAASDAKSKLLSPEAPVFDANHPDPATLTPEQIERRTAMRTQVEAQIKDSNAQITALTARANQEMLPQQDRNAAVFSAVDQANLAISLARANDTVLDRESFRDGEIEFYNLGEITELIDHVSSLLQTYALKNPSVAEAAAHRLEGLEVQTQVDLAIAIREMTGGQPYLVPPEKPPIRKANTEATTAVAHRPSPQSTN